MIGTAKEIAMPSIVRHFAINADDVQRARRFYEVVFGWQFSPWGPPNYYQIHNAGEGLIGALQERQVPLTGTGMRGYEITIGIDDLEQTMAAVTAHGGRLSMGRFRIEGVGDLAFFEDTEGNRVGAMQYDPGVFA